MISLTVNGYQALRAALFNTLVRKNIVKGHSELRNRPLVCLVTCLLTGCSLTRDIEPSVVGRGTTGSNLVINSSFEDFKNGRPNGWSGRCFVSDDIAKSGGRSLVLSDEAVCISAPIPVAGETHYEGSLWLSGNGLNPDEDLGRALAVSLKAFDENGTELPIPVRFLRSERDGSLVSSRLRGIPASLLEGIGHFTRITLAPGDYPLDGGWLPQKAVTAQLEIRFRGTGKLLIDDVEFKKSKWNLSLNERVNERELIPYRYFPVPQYVGNSTRLRNASRIKDCVTILSPEFTVRDWQSHRFPQKPGAHENCLPVKISRLTDCRHLTEGGFDVCEEALASKEAYTVSTDSAAVIIRAASQDAVTYALDTFHQMFEEWVLFDEPLISTIVDFPSTTLRSNSALNVLSGEDLSEGTESQVIGISRINEARLNTIFLEVEPRSGPWWSPSAKTREEASRIVEARKYGSSVHLGIMVNPYSGDNNVSLPLKFEIGNSLWVDRVLSVFEHFRRVGMESFVLRADDLVAKRKGTRFGYFLASAVDRARFQSLADAHAELLNKLAVQLGSQKNPLLFVPPWYNWWFVANEFEDGMAYGSTLAKKAPSEVPIVWTGPTVRSLFIDELDILRFSEHLENRPLILWDNSIFARDHKDFWRGRPDREKLLSFFEPFDVPMPLVGSHGQEGDANGLLRPMGGDGVILFSPFSEIARPRLATAGAYWWNPKDYNPERALWTYMMRRFGVKTTRLLFLFDEMYWNDSSRALVTQESRAELHGLLDEIARNGGVEVNALVKELRSKVGLTVAFEDLPQ